MSKFNKIQNSLEKVLIPISAKLGQNEIIKAISGGMTMFLPITLGGAIFSLLADFPVTSISEWFQTIGLTPVFRSISAVTINAMSLYIVFCIAFRYAANKKKNGALSGLFAVASFFVLMPQSVGEGELATAALSLSYLGSSGIFVAMIVGVLIAMLYVRLMNVKQLVIKLPDSVPPMISQSLEPLVIGILVFVAVCVVKFGMLCFTNQNIFELINAIIGKPIMALGGSTTTFIIVGIISNLLFFIGIHPVSVVSVLSPVIMGLLTQAIEQFQTNQTLSQLDVLAVYHGATVGGVGCTLSLLFVMILTAKSKQYRVFSKVALIPNCMNVNEPVIFGLPIVLNPLLFIPFVLTGVVGKVICLIAVKIGFLTSLNPLLILALPFTTPPFLMHFLIGGWKYLLIAIVVFLIDALLYLPFFKIMDKNALALEKTAEAIDSQTEKA